MSTLMLCANVINSELQTPINLLGSLCLRLLSLQSLKMVESLPDDLQEKVAEHIRDYIADLETNK